VRNRKGEFRKEIASDEGSGYQRAKINGELVRLGKAQNSDKKFKQDIDVDGRPRRSCAKAVGNSVRRIVEQALQTCRWVWAMAEKC